MPVFLVLNPACRFIFHFRFLRLRLLFCVCAWSAHRILCSCRPFPRSSSASATPFVLYIPVFHFSSFDDHNFVINVPLAHASLDVHYDYFKRFQNVFYLAYTVPYSSVLLTPDVSQ